MADKIKTIFFGTGGYANFVMEAFQYAKLKDLVELDTVVARNVKKLKNFQERFGFNNFSTDRDARLKERADLKLIVTPAPTHAEMIREIENSKIIWSEKPIAMNCEQAELLVKENKEQSKIVALDYTYNNDPQLQRLARIVKSGELGTINSIHAHFLRRDFTDVKEPFDPSRNYRRASLDLAPHLIAGFDLMGLEAAAVKNVSLINPEQFHKEPWNDGGVVELRLKTQNSTEVRGKIDISMAREGGHSNGFEVYFDAGKYFWIYEMMSPAEGYGQAYLKFDPEITTDKVDQEPNYQEVDKGLNRLEMLGKQWDLVLGLIDKTHVEAVKKLGPSSDEQAVKHQRVVDLIEHATRDNNWHNVKI